jgi:hypothetical protein
MSSPTEKRLSEAFHDLAAEQPFTPDPAAIEHRALRSRRRARFAQGGVIAGVVVVVAGLAFGVTGGIGSPTAGVPQAGGPIAVTGASNAAPVAAPLVTLAADLAGQPQPTTGDATLVERVQAYPNQAGPSGAGGWDLYTDDGRYFYSQTKAGLPDQIRAGNDPSEGGFAREDAAALYAVHGDLNTARLRLAWAAMSPSTPMPPDFPTQRAKDGTLLLNNRIWENSQDALISGSTNPQIRAGVLRLLATLPQVAVTRSTVDGQPALVLTAGAGEVGRDYQEALTINASTGMPMKFVGGLPSDVGVNVTYTCTRVTLSDVESGKF